MRRLARFTGGALAGLAAFAMLGIGPALGQQQTTVSKFSGDTGGSGGIWTRTIMDVTEPNRTQVTYPVSIPYLPGLSADSMAARYRKAVAEQVPLPPAGANAYGTANQKYRDFAGVRLAKQKGTYSITGDAGAPPNLVATAPPANAEDAPIASPLGLASLAAGLSAVAWWVRRRRTSA